ALFREYAMFCAAVLALLGLGDLSRSNRDASAKEWKWLAMISGLTSMAATAGYFYIVSRSQNRGDLFSRASWQVGVVWIGSTAVAFLAWLAPRTRKWVPVLLIMLAVSDTALTVLVMQKGVLHFVSSAGPGRSSWDMLNAEHVANLDLVHNGFNRVLRTQDSSIDTNNQNVLVKVGTFENYETMWNRFEFGFWARPALLAICTGPERIWFAKEAAIVRPTDRTYDAFSKRTEKLSAPVIIVHPPENMPDIRERNLRTPE